MKISCPACSAAYRIPDSRVRGKNKVFRVGCKRCGAEIRVRGIATEEDTGRATMPFNLQLPERAPETPQRLWFAGIDGKQDGPLTEQEVFDHIAAGRLGAGDLVWRKGFSAWTPAREVAPFKGALPDRGRGPAVKRATGRKRSPRRAQTLELSAQMIELLVKLDEQSAAGGEVSKPTVAAPPRFPSGGADDDAKREEPEAEAARQAEAARKAEAARQAEAARKAEAARRAEAARQAEAARKAEAARQAEAARKAEAPPIIPMNKDSEEDAPPPTPTKERGRRGRRGRRRRVAATGPGKAAPGATRPTAPARAVKPGATAQTADSRTPAKTGVKVSLPGQAGHARRASSHATAAAGKIASLGGGAEAAKVTRKPSGMAAKAQAGKKGPAKGPRPRKGGTRAGRPDGGGSGAAIGIGVAAALVVIGGVLLVSSRRKKTNAKKAAPAPVAVAEPRTMPAPPVTEPLRQPSPPPNPGADAGATVDLDAGGRADSGSSPGADTGTAGAGSGAAGVGSATEDVGGRGADSSAAVALAHGPGGGAADRAAGKGADKGADKGTDKETRKRRSHPSDHGGGGAGSASRVEKGASPTSIGTARSGDDEIDRILAEERRKAEAERMRKRKRKEGAGHKKASHAAAGGTTAAAGGGQDDIDRILAAERRRKAARKTASAASPSGTTGSTAKKGKLSDAEVSRIAARERSSIMRCYMTYADVDGSVETIKVKLRVQGSGSVQSARVLGKYGKNEVGKCISAALKRITFPSTSSATASYTVRYTVGG